jgi:hypothetical protein
MIREKQIIIIKKTKVDIKNQIKSNFKGWN